MNHAGAPPSHERICGEPQGEFANTILMEDKADIVIDAGTGWVSASLLTGSVNLGTCSQIDTTTIVESVK